MDRYQGQQGYGANQVDEYGNPVARHGATGGMGGTYEAPGAFTGTGGGQGQGQQFQPTNGEHKTGGILHRSGSSSSSSSEDDGVGGRRKKGMKEKIKEKFPGGHKENQQHMAAGTGGAYGQQQGYGGMTGTGAGAHGVDTGEKKGLMDKIKEKLPGQH
ncbi:dehydrin Rab16B [Brachypodium distachyon]|uniref:Dehydrin n=1 Tax=Brachypodium distachyon TaxID=15368 RepID=I1I9V1_BRADI|nr:dehydrin Rab16B [Brachypodium distachyon]KQJ99554.1 hypothetical protein BRADI_3g43855v3 [Brachypodium distachyon]|eukprot:XP_010235454.1 dehydrin Rab16B [Brachypodium distachyon]